MYERKSKIIKQAVESDKTLYLKKLTDLKAQLVQALESQNDVVRRIKDRDEQTRDKRKEVNELMVKCKLILEEDIQQEHEEADESIKDLPEEVDIETDPLVNKINTALSRHKKHKRKNRNNRSKR